MSLRRRLVLRHILAAARDRERRSSAGRKGRRALTRRPERAHDAERELFRRERRILVTVSGMTVGFCHGYRYASPDDMGDAAS